jgi:4-diphosphocytidyl-2-C-methyl-D-erythritol kinase
VDEVWPAPAKLNLMLRVVGRRPDGYHLLQTVFQFLERGDELQFRVREDGIISRRLDLAGVAEEQDLALRAARMLQDFSGTSLGAEVELRKRLPMGGGLGGGSSDAATALVALNRIWGTGLSVEQLEQIGLQLGADVPVFVRGHAAWAEGVGEQLTAVEPPEVWYLVLAPDCQVSTAEIFSDPQLTRDSPQITIADFFSGSQGNDCLPVVVRHYPEVAEAIRWLSQFTEPRLTGTGACVFAAFPDRDAADTMLEQLPDQLTGFVARGLNRSPLLERLEAE